MTETVRLRRGHSKEAARSRDLARLAAARADLTSTLDALDLAVADSYPVELTGVYRHVTHTLALTLDRLERLSRAARRYSLDAILGGALTRMRGGGR